jgi:hypothetical protein
LISAALQCLFWPTKRERKPLYTVILNLIVAIVLAPILNTVSSKRTPMDATVPADYRA